MGVFSSHKLCVIGWCAFMMSPHLSSIQSHNSSSKYSWSRCVRSCHIVIWCGHGSLWQQRDKLRHKSNDSLFSYTDKKSVTEKQRSNWEKWWEIRASINNREKESMRGRGVIYFFSFFSRSLADKVVISYLSGAENKLLFVFCFFAEYHSYHGRKITNATVTSK